MATPARIRRMTVPPGVAATAAPFAPAMNAPEAATRVPAAGPVVVDDTLPAAVVEVAAVAEVVVDESAAAVPAVEPDGAVVVVDPAFLSGPALEQAAPITARMRTRRRRFTGAHHRGAATRL
jgi:hypothetical protein